MSSASMTNQPAPAADGDSRSTPNPCACSCACARARAGTQKTSAKAITMARLELRMDLHGEDVDRAAVRVEAGVPEELVIGGQPDRALEVHAVEALDHAFGPLAQRAVADEPVDAAHG